MKNSWVSGAAIELTDGCNFRCRHCFQTKDNRQHSISREMALHALDLFSQGGVMDVTLTGGEPMLHRNFVEIYLYSRSVGLATIIFSNGSTVTPEIWEAFEWRPPHAIEFSLYGDSNRSYREFTQRASYETVARNIRHASACGIPVSLKFPLVRSMLPSVEGMLGLARELEVSIMCNVQIIGSAEYLSREALSASEIAKLNEEYGLHLAAKKDFVGCDMGRTVYVTSRGMIQGCAAYSSESFQNIAEISDMSDLDLRSFARVSREFGGVCPAWMLASDESENRLLLEMFGAVGNDADV